MTLNGHFALKSVSGSATNMLASPAFGQNCLKICRSTHILSATKMYPRERSFWQYKVYADIRGGSLERGRQMRVGSFKMAIFVSFVHSSEHFAYITTWQLSGDTTVNDLGHISRSLDCFTSNFSKTVCDTAKLLSATNRKSYTSFRLVPFLMTLKYVWRSFQPRLSFPRPFQQSLACFRVARTPSNSWASCIYS